MVGTMRQRASLTQHAILVFLKLLQVSLFQRYLIGHHECECVQEVFL